MKYFINVLLTSVLIHTLTLFKMEQNYLEQLGCNHTVQQRSCCMAFRRRMNHDNTALCCIGLLHVAILSQNSSFDLQVSKVKQNWLHHNTVMLWKLVSWGINVCVVWSYPYTVQKNKWWRGRLAEIETASASILLQHCTTDIILKPLF